jgi:hypothetical protein
MKRFLIIQKSIDSFRNLSKSRKTLLVAFVVLLFFCSPLIYHRLLLLYRGTVCAINGGEWRTGGPGAAQHFCLYSYPDGGKSCHSSEECMGSCVIYEEDLGQSTLDAGVCQENNNPYDRCFVFIEAPEILGGCSD